MSVEQATRAVKVARNALTLHQPFFGPISYALNYVVVDGENALITTAATDNESVFFNAEFMLLLESVADREFVQAHEIMHVILMSLQRMGSRDIMIWNAATDYCINGALVKSGMKMPKIPDKFGKKNIVGLYDKKYEGLIPEEIYDLLLNDPNFKAGSLDQHIDGKIVLDGTGGKVVRRTQQSTETIKRRIKNVVAQATMSAGEVPGVLRRMIEIGSAPQINWNEVLNSKLLSYKTSDYAWTPPEKSIFWSGITIPSMTEDPKIKASLAVDVSGSIDKVMLSKMFTEIIAIASNFSSWELQVVLFDAIVQNSKIYSSDADTDRDILTHEILGGGGTLFQPFFEFVEKSGFEPDVLIVFTDGYSSDGWRKEFLDKFDVLWVMTSDAIPSWGQYVKFDNYVV